MNESLRGFCPDMAPTMSHQIETLRTELAEARSQLAAKDADIQALREVLEFYIDEDDAGERALAVMSVPHPGAELLRIRDAAKALRSVWESPELSFKVDSDELVSAIENLVAAIGTEGGK